ncbi:Peptidase C [Trema orientale]|uniref:Peptidase C n=1 Tax=Trema orientale TaxID=63057 RepID=A0A2P5EAE8_TREOI|nr:Peptidase C [Trema orientale]
MGSLIMGGGKALEMLEVGPCKDGYQMGFLIGRRFADQIRSRLGSDLILQNQLRPFAQSPQSQPLLQALSSNNQKRFPRYWDELVGMAEGSGVAALDIILINFRKEILPFLPKTGLCSSPTPTVDDTSEDDCSDVLVVSDSMAIAAHNEDANVALVGHTYLIKGALSNGLSFIAYTYAGELPSCAFGVNSHGLAFTLNSVPPSEKEIVAGGIGRNFISRDILEATSIDNALSKIRSSEVSVGHSYNLIETRTRRIVNVETASRNRISVYEVGETPYFRANMYLHLQVPQVQDENSISRQRKAAVLPKSTREDFLAVLGDSEDPKYPIYMTGPTLYTLCTAVIDIDQQTLSIIQGNPQNGEVSHVFDMSSKDFKLL